MLTLRDFTVLLKDKPLHQALSLSLESRQCCALVGGEGSGKTAILNGLSGSVSFKGETNIIVNSLYQVGDRIKRPRFFKGGINQDVYDYFATHFSEIDAGRAKQSRGQEQLMFMVNFLAQSSELVLLDSPFLNLDVLIITKLAEHWQAILDVVNLPLIFTTNNEKEALRFTQAIYCL